MERLYFHDSAQFLDRLKDAVDSAVKAARAQWELRGRASGVRLELPNCLCAEEWTYGSLGYAAR